MNAMPTFRGKRFTDASLLGLAKIETIRGIALYDTVVTDDGLVAFAAKAKRLAQFHMSSAALTDRGLSAVLNSCPIANLQIHDAVGVTDAVAPLIAKHTDITELYLNGTGISDEALVAFADMPNVWSLFATGSRITDGGLASLSRMPKLSLIGLSATRVLGHGVRELASLDGLNIYLEDCRIGDEEIVASLPRMSKMRLLSLSRTDVTDGGLKSIGACVRLEDLRLNDTGITDATLKLLEDLPNLQVLYVNGTDATRDGVRRVKASKRRMSVYSAFQGDDA